MLNVKKVYILFSKMGLEVSKIADVERIDGKHDRLIGRSVEIVLLGINLISIKQKDNNKEVYFLDSANYLISILDRFIGNKITQKVHYDLAGQHFSFSTRIKGTINLLICKEDGLASLEIYLTPEEAFNLKHCLYHALKFIAQVD